MLIALDIAVFVLFIVAVITIGIVMSRKGADDSESYFLAGRGLSWWLIGFSLIAANISTEQFVGMSGDAARSVGLAIAGYEWLAAVTLVFVAFFFLPKFLRAGIYTIPEFLEQRYNQWARLVMSLFTMLMLVVVNISAVIYSGALLVDVLIDHPLVTVQNASILIGCLAAGYVMFGGLKACAWADLLQGSALILGGVLILFFALAALDKEDPEVLAKNAGIEVSQIADASPIQKFLKVHDEKLCTVRPANDSKVPWTALIIGLWIPNFFYWGLNQYIMQRTLGAQSLGEGQKGVVFAAGMKLLIPFIVIFPGMMAFTLFKDDMQEEARKKTNVTSIVQYEQLAGYSTGLLEGLDEKTQKSVEELKGKLAADKESGKMKPIIFNVEGEFDELYPDVSKEIYAYNKTVADKNGLKYEVKKEGPQGVLYFFDLLGFGEAKDNIDGSKRPPEEAAAETDDKDSPEKDAEQFVQAMEAPGALAVNNAIVKAAGGDQKFTVAKQMIGREQDAAFPLLIKKLVPPGGLQGFMLAAIMGAVLSSLASMLNAASTIFSMDLYKRYFAKDAEERSLVSVGRICVVVFAVLGMIVAPYLNHPMFGGIFSFIQEFQGFISPGILAVFLFGLFVRRASAMAGMIGLVANPIIYGGLKWLDKIPGLQNAEWAHQITNFAFLDRMAVTFFLILGTMAIVTLILPRKEKYEFKINTTMNLESSVLAKILGTAVVLAVVGLYWIFRGDAVIPF